MSSSDSPLLGWKPLSDKTPEPPVSSAQAGMVPGAPPPGAASASGFFSAGPPRFQRVPRNYVEPPDKTVEISAPPAMPTTPSTATWVLVISIIALLASVAGIGGYAYISYQAGQNLADGAQASPISQLWWIPLLTGFTALGSAAGIVQQLFEPRRYRNALARRDTAYRGHISDHTNTLDQLCAEQRQAALVTHPTLDVCFRRVADRDPRLWERTIDRDLGRDLLDLRIGVGTMPPTFSIKTPQEHSFQIDVDPLAELAQKLATTYTQVDDVPIALPFIQVGSVGVAGERRRLQHLTSALLIQLTTHHAPNEVKLVVCYPEHEAQDWAWIRWLPHTWSDDRSQRFVAGTPEAARKLLVDLDGIFKQRELARRNDEPQAAPDTPLYLIVFADPDLLSGGEAAALAPLLERLKRGSDLGVFALFLHDRVEQIRKECGAVVDLARNVLRLVGPPQVEYTFTPDTIEAIAAERFARTLAPLRVQSHSAANQLPALLTLLDMFGVARIDDLPILQNWTASYPFKSLAVPIGVRAGGAQVLLDVHARGEGPHGLGAGTTGSGKSELLQTLIAALAVTFHPHELAFVLIDYKGGGMAAPFRNLPHQAGIITNLEAELMPRAINALKVENEYRQRLLDQVGVNNIDDYQPLVRAGTAPEPLPHLLIIVDEFAELAQNQPELMDRLISVARVGRSLGVHLLLATQKPAGIVNEQIWSNSNYRLCLRVAQPEDSQELLKRPDAAMIPNSFPGRGYLQVGQNERFELFQSAFSGAPYRPGASVERAVAAVVGLDGKRRSLQAPATATARSAATQTQTQLQALVAHLHDLAQQQQLAPLTPPWLPPLPEQLPLSHIRAGLQAGWDGQTWQPGSAWMEPLVGLLDQPHQRSQVPLALPLSQGHLAIYGAPGTGKTTLLQTIALSLALDHTPDELNLYMLDFGGRRMKLFESLPHVGGVVLPDNDEHIKRLFFMLQQEIDQRKDGLVRAGVSSFAEYHRQVPGASPAIVVLIDNYVAFADNFGEQADELITIASEGGSLGIYLVIASGSASSINYRLANSLSLAIALELNDIGEYPGVVGRTDGLVPAKGVRGRGLWRDTPPLELQVALPGDQSGDAALRDQIMQLAQSWSGARARPIPVLPLEVALDSILMPAPGWSDQHDRSIPIGIDADTMKPLIADLGEMPNHLIVGPPDSGKTTLLQSMLLALAERYSPDQMQLFVSGLTGTQLYPFTRLPHTKAYIEDSGRLDETITELVALLNQRRQQYEQEQRNSGQAPDERVFTAHFPLLVLAIDEYDEARSSMYGVLDDTWRELTRLGRRFGLAVLSAGSSAYFQSFFGDELGKALKEQGSIILLGGTDAGSVHSFGLRLQPEERGQIFGPGRGYYKRRSMQRFFQGVSCHAGTLQLAEWIEQIRKRQP